MSNRAHVNSIRTTLDRVGITPPEAAARALETLEAITAAASRDHYAEALATVHELTPDNAAERVHELALAMSTRTHLTGAARHLEGPVARAYVDAIRADVDGIIAQMRPAFDAAAATVAVATDLVPEGTTPADLLTLGDAAIAAHRAVESARSTLTLVNAARVTLARLTGEGDTPRVSWYVAPSNRGMDELRQAGAVWQRGLRWERLLTRGFTLRLNTPGEAAAIEAGAGAADAAALEAQRAARVEANRDPLRDRVYAGVLGNRDEVTS